MAQDREFGRFQQVALMELFEKHPKMIVFYNFDYELDILKNLYYGENVEVAEWNGHRHQPIPASDSWSIRCKYHAVQCFRNCRFPNHDVRL